MKALLGFAPLFGRIRGPMAATLALSLVTLAAGIALLGVSGWFLTAAALTTAGAAFSLFAPSAGVRALSFVRILSRYGEKITGHNATLKLLSDLRQWTFARLFPIVPLDRRFGRSDLVSRLTADIDALDTLFLLALGPVATALLAGLAMTLGLAIAMPAAALPYGLAYFAAVLGVPAVLLFASRKPGAAVLEASAELRRAVLDGLDGHQDLVAFGAIGATLDNIQAAAAQLAAARRRLALLGALATGATQVLAGAAITGTFIAGFGVVRAGMMDGPLLAGLLLAVVASFEASAMLVRSTTRLAGAAASAERLATLTEASPATIEAGSAHAGPGGEIAFDRVGYGYDDGSPVLNGLSFSIASGACVAIAGPSGAGKSTIAHLMVRLDDPRQGTIRLNGTDIRAMNVDELRRRVALMTQDAPVFNDTIRNNLLIGNPDASDADLWAALRAVRLDGLVENLPGELESVVGEAGRTLSAGQARRLCLARSLLSPADVLVLDEPTTGIDADAEAAFLLDLRELAAGRTVIVITHAALPEGAFDRVLRIRDGWMEPHHA